jgi:hypothetical protein
MVAYRPIAVQLCWRCGWFVLSLARCQPRIAIAPGLHVEGLQGWLSLPQWPCRSSVDLQRAQKPAPLLKLCRCCSRAGVATRLWQQVPRRAITDHGWNSLSREPFRHPDHQRDPISLFSFKDCVHRPNVPTPRIMTSCHQQLRGCFR